MLLKKVFLVFILLIFSKVSFAAPDNFLNPDRFKVKVYRTTSTTTSNYTAIPVSGNCFIPWIDVVMYTNGSVGFNTTSSTQIQDHFGNLEVQRYYPTVMSKAFTFYVKSETVTSSIQVTHGIN